MADTHNDPSTVLSAAQALKHLLDMPPAGDTSIVAIEQQILTAPRSDDQTLREIELRAQGEVALGRLEVVHDSLKRDSSEQELLRPVVAWLRILVGSELPLPLMA